MRGVCVGAERPVERVARQAGYEIVDAPHCRRGHWYQVGDRVIILAPTWLPGTDVREGVIARQMALYGLAVCGPGRFGEALATMRGHYAATLAGLPPGALPPLTDLADGLAAD